MPGSATRANALDHVVVVAVREPVAGQRAGPPLRARGWQGVRGVIGKELSNPIPRWAEHGAGRKVVPYGVTTDHGFA